MPRPAEVVPVAIARLRARLQARHRGVEIGPGVRFGKGSRCTAGPGAHITVGAGAEVGVATALVALPGARLTVGSGAFIGNFTFIAAATHISIGSESMVGDMVNIRDQDHDPAHPPKSGRMLDGEVHIGERVWIGAKASVVRGGGVADDAVVGAHALVNRPVPAASLAVGVPARVVREGLRATGAG